MSKSKPKPAPVVVVRRIVENSSGRPRVVASCPLGGFYVVQFNGPTSAYVCRPNRHDVAECEALDAQGLTEASNPSTIFRGASYPNASAHMARADSGAWAPCVDGYRARTYGTGSDFATRNIGEAFGTMLGAIEVQCPGILERARVADLLGDIERVERELDRLGDLLNVEVAKRETLARALGTGPVHLARVGHGEDGRLYLALDGASIGLDLAPYGLRLGVDFEGARTSLDGLRVGSRSCGPEDDARALAFGTPDPARAALQALANSALDMLAGRHNGAELLRLASQHVAHVDTTAEVATYLGLDDVIRAARAYVVAVDDMGDDPATVDRGESVACDLRAARQRLALAADAAGFEAWATPATRELSRAVRQALAVEGLGQFERRAGRRPIDPEALASARLALLDAVEPWAYVVES